MKKVISALVLALFLGTTLGASAAPAPVNPNYGYISVTVQDKGYQNITMQIVTQPDGTCSGVKPQNGWCYYPMYKHQLSNGFYNWTIVQNPGTGDALYLRHGEYRVGFVVNGQWQTPTDAYAGSTKLTCLNDQAQLVFTSSAGAPGYPANVSVGCDNITRTMGVDLAYAPLDKKTTHAVSFFSTLNGWKEVKANVNTSNGVYWYHFDNVVYDRGDHQGQKWIFGAMVDGKWYTGDNLFANGVLVTCRDEVAGVAQFRISPEKTINTMCTNIPKRANIDVTYVPRSNEKNTNPSILGGFNGWVPQTITSKNSDGNYVVKYLDVEVGSYFFGYLINNGWRSDLGRSWVNGTKITSENAQHQLGFCLKSDWKVTSGACQ